MTWQVTGNTGNACLLVDASSGIVFYEPDQPRDSKILVTTDPSLQPPRRGDVSLLGRWSSATTILKGVSSATASADEVKGEAEAIRLSTKTFKKEYNKKKNESRALERVMSISQGEAAREKEEEEKAIQRVVSLSIFESKNEMEDEECLQRVIELSRQEFNAEDEVEADFNWALELSLKEESCQMQTVLKEEEHLQQVMDLSKQEFQTEKNGGGILLQSLERAKKDTPDVDLEEDEELLRVLEQSLLDF
jgi:hypothetical protein